MKNFCKSFNVVICTCDILYVNSHLRARTNPFCSLKTNRVSSWILATGWQSLFPAQWRCREEWDPPWTWSLRGGCNRCAFADDRNRNHPHHPINQLKEREDRNYEIQVLTIFSEGGRGNSKRKHVHNWNFSTFSMHIYSTFWHTFIIVGSFVQYLW